MVEITLTGDVAQRLQEVAARENQSPEEWLRGLLDTQAASHVSGTEKNGDGHLPNPLLKMAEMARAANLVFTENDVVERSREILDSAFADDIIRRMQDKDA